MITPLFSWSLRANAPQATVTSKVESKGNPQHPFRAYAGARLADDAFGRCDSPSLPDIVGDPDVHRTILAARSAASAFRPIRPDPHEGNRRADLQKSDDGTDVLAEGPVVAKAYGKRDP